MLEDDVDGGGVRTGNLGVVISLSTSVSVKGGDLKEASL